MSAEFPMSKDLMAVLPAATTAAEVPAPEGSPAEDSVRAAGGGAEPLELTRLLPPRGWQLVNVRELWKFRELLYFLTWRDVKVRYKQTALGAAWAVLQPAMMMVVFTLLFGRMVGVDTGGLPYPVFAYLALVPWSFFSTAITNGGNSVVGSERLITKIYFPRLAIPFAAAGASVVDFLLSFSLVVVLMFWYRVTPGPSILLLPLIFLVIFLLAT